ncbi:hypothetical protein ACHAW6_001607 [Cyclotella cf. meneghiniana]
MNKDQGRNSPPPPAPSAHPSLAAALLPSLPALMHSSGDALPEHVSPHSVAFLSTLIERYVTSLVCAAMDAHDVYTDGNAVGGAAALGIPPFRKRPSVDNEPAEASSDRVKKRRIDYWDEPLQSDDEDADSSEDDDDDEDAPLLSSSLRRRNSSSSSPVEPSSLHAVAASLDLHPTRTSRHYSNKMDVRSFIFPICHDAVLYQRVKEVQSQRRRIGRDVVDGCLMRVAREEGEKLLGRAAGDVGVLDVWDAVWKRDGIGAGVGATALVQAGLVDGEGAEASCWTGVDALGWEEIRCEEPNGESRDVQR